MRLPSKTSQVTCWNSQVIVGAKTNVVSSFVLSTIRRPFTLPFLSFLITLGYASTICELLPIDVSYRSKQMAHGDIVGAARHLGSLTVPARYATTDELSVMQSTENNHKQQDEPESQAAPIIQPSITTAIGSNQQQQNGLAKQTTQIAQPLIDTQERQAILERLKQPFAIPADPFNDLDNRKTIASRIVSDTFDAFDVPSSPLTPDRLFMASVESGNGQAENPTDSQPTKKEPLHALSHPISNATQSLKGTTIVALDTFEKNTESKADLAKKLRTDNKSMFHSPTRVPHTSCPNCKGKVEKPVSHGSPYERSSPWPTDEYICDGGDGNQKTRVKADWSLQGLEMEDSIAHYDTLDGRTVVKTICRNCIYSPRFAAVRQIDGVVEHQQQEQMKQVSERKILEIRNTREMASTVLEQKQPVQQKGRKPVNIFRDRQDIGALGQTRITGTLDHRFLPHENLKAIRYGIYDQSEKPLLAEFSDAAQSWAHDAAVQVVLEDTVAYVDVTHQEARVLYKVDPQGKPKMCVVKTASCKSARPGDFIDFTLRFDNIGNERIGNVTLIDNLTPRLEYVPETAQSSLDADFLAEENEGGSLMLRWEIKAPVKPGKGGIIRFRCKVR